MLSRHPEIQDLELDFLLKHIRHPDITIRLPLWTDRFARGQLSECGDTFLKLIHRLACAAAPNLAVNPAAVGPFGSAQAMPGTLACPRGCPMSTMRAQHRCSTCGYVAVTPA